MPLAQVMNENINLTPTKSNGICDEESELRVTTKRKFNVNVPQKGRDFSQTKGSPPQNVEELTKFDDNAVTNAHQLRGYLHPNNIRGSFMTSNGKRGSLITSNEKRSPYDKRGSMVTSCGKINENDIISVRAVPVKDSIMSQISNRDELRKSRIRSVTMLGERNGGKTDQEFTGRGATSFVSNIQP